MMKNNKGFSMIELLAVVVIIGILAGLAVIAYGRHLENARRNAFENMATTLYESTKSYFLTSGILPAVGDTAEILATDLLDAGYIETLTSPRNDRDNCNDSVIYVDRSMDSADGFNMTLRYRVEVICANQLEFSMQFPRGT